MADSTRKEVITEFQVAAAASHFRDQGSLTVGCLHLLFLHLLARSRVRRGGGGGGGGGCTRRVDHILNVDVNTPVEYSWSR